MECFQCGEKFNVDDKVIYMREDGDLLHEGECFVDYVLENFGEEPKPYLDFLESER
jgi:hypothetical protein